MATENDIVLIHIEDKPTAFARIEDISADHKPGWYHVRLLLLQIPVQVITWILRDVYIDGEEFTMGGQRMRLERVVSPEITEPEADDTRPETGPPATAPEDRSAPKNQGKVISLADLKKKS